MNFEDKANTVFATCDELEDEGAIARLLCMLMYDAAKDNIPFDECWQTMIKIQEKNNNE